MNYERLDDLVRQVQAGNEDGVGVLSSGERRYVALAANRGDLLSGDTVAEAVRLLRDEGVLDEMLRRWTW